MHRKSITLGIIILAVPLLMTIAASFGHAVINPATTVSNNMLVNWWTSFVPVKINTAVQTQDAVDRW